VSSITQFARTNVSVCLNVLNIFFSWHISLSLCLVRTKLNPWSAAFQTSSDTHGLWLPMNFQKFSFLVKYFIMQIHCWIICLIARHLQTNIIAYRTSCLSHTDFIYVDHTNSSPSYWQGMKWLHLKYLLYLCDTVSFHIWTACSMNTLNGYNSRCSTYKLRGIIYTYCNFIHWGCWWIFHLYFRMSCLIVSM
jgi:hypothetical protein